MRMTDELSLDKAPGAWSLPLSPIGELRNNRTSAEITMFSFIGNYSVGVRWFAIISATMQIIIVILMNVEGWFDFIKFGLIGVVAAMLPTGPVGSLLIGAIFYTMIRHISGYLFILWVLFFSALFFALQFYVTAKMNSNFGGPVPIRQCSLLLSLIFPSDGWNGMDCPTISTNYIVTSFGYKYHTTFMILLTVAFSLSAMLCKLRITHRYD